MVRWYRRERFREQITGDEFLKLNELAYKLENGLLKPNTLLSIDISILIPKSEIRIYLLHYSIFVTL